MIKHGYIIKSNMVIYGYIGLFRYFYIYIYNFGYYLSNKLYTRYEIELIVYVVLLLLYLLLLL